METISHTVDREAEFDAAVIGGGPGGYVCAIRCAQLGLKTALVEKRELGGTCLNRGCIPTKALLHSGELFHALKQHGPECGISAEQIQENYSAAASKKERVVQQLRGGVEALVKGRGITVLAGQAILTGDGTFAVDGQTYTAKNIILATGSEPSFIPVPGADLPGVMNSDDVLGLTELPESVVIIGGGVIGVEFATLFASFGKQVAIVELQPRLLPEMDEDLSKELTRQLKRRGIKIHTSAALQEIRSAEAGMECHFLKADKPDCVQGSKVIMAVGRRPVTGGIGLEACGIAMKRGFVLVDEGMRTSVPGIYAIGDITGKLQLAHVASAQALVAAANAAGGNRTMNYEVVPACVYSDPEIASVGKTESQLKEAGIPYKKGSFPVSANGRSMIMDCTSGFFKLLADEATGRVLGTQIMAPRATDMIGEIAVAMRVSATAEDIADTIHAHPTVSEIMMEAAHDVEGLCCHKLK